MFQLLGYALLILGMLFAVGMGMAEQPPPVIGLGILVAIAGGLPCILIHAWETGELRGKYGFVIRRDSSPELFYFFYILNWVLCVVLIGGVIWICYLGPAGLVPQVEFPRRRRRPKPAAVTVQPRDLAIARFGSARAQACTLAVPPLAPMG